MCFRTVVRFRYEYSAFRGCKSITSGVGAAQDVHPPRCLLDGPCRHPCLQYFKYTTGAVLASLAKDDLRRQCKDVEAAHIIWYELNAHRKSMAEKQEIEVD